MTEISDRYNAARGTVLLGSQQIMAYATYFVFAVVLARILTPAEIGEVSLLAATMAIFGGLTQLGLPSTAVQFISSALGKGDTPDAGAIAKSILRLMLASAGLGAAIAIPISLVVGDVVFRTPNGATLLVATFGSGVLLDFTTLYGGYFLGAGLYAKAVYQNLLYIPLSRGLGLLLAFAGFGVIGIVAGWLIGGLLTLFFSMYMWRGIFPSKATFPTKPILAFGIPIFISSLIILLQGWSDIAILQALTGQFETTGAYYLVVTSVGFLSILWTPLVSALYPVLSLSHAAEGSDAVVDRLNQALRLSNLTVLPLAASVSAVAPTALEAVFGPAYSQQANTLAILALITIFSAQGALLLSSLQAIGRPRSVLTVTASAFVTDVIVVILTANSLGTIGAAFGRAILAFATVSLSYLVLRPTIKASIWQGLGKAIPLAIAVGIALWAVDQVLFGIQPLARLPILLGVFIIAFSVTARGLKAFTIADYELVASSLPHRLRKYLAIVRVVLIQ